MARRRSGTTAAQLLGWLADLPEVEERETWGHPTFRVRGRMLGTLDAAGTSTTLKASPEEQQALIAGDPATYSFPAYVGRHGWVTVVLATADPDQVHELAVEAWRRTAPKRLVAAYDARPDVTASSSAAAPR